MTDLFRDVRDLRVHPRADVVPFPDPDLHEQMAADVERRGIVTPLDILPDGTVLDGRTRLSIARVLGIATVPVRIVEPEDPYDFMVRAAFMRRDLTPSQKAMLSLELPEYRKAKEEAAARKESSKAQPGERADIRIRTQETTPSRASDTVATVAGVSGSYIRKAELVAKHDPDLAASVKAGDVTVNTAASIVRERLRDEPKEEPEPNVKEATEPKTTGRLPVPKRTLRPRPWSRHFTTWCRAALPEDKPVLLDMAREIDQALSRIGATR